MAKHALGHPLHSWRQGWRALQLPGARGQLRQQLPQVSLELPLLRTAPELISESSAMVQHVQRMAHGRRGHPKSMGLACVIEGTRVVVAQAGSVR